MLTTRALHLTVLNRSASLLLTWVILDDELFYRVVYDDFFEERKSMEIEDFFKEKDVDDYAVLSVSSAESFAGVHPSNLLPNAKSIIIFAKQIPEFVFLIDNRIKTNYLYSLIKEMDRISYDFSVSLNNEGFNTVPLPCFFPIKLEDGKLKGYLSFKHLAEQAGMGSIGLNSLLISEKYGNSLCLSGIITEKPLTVKYNKLEKSLCHECNKCVHSCPAKAINNGCVEATKCINLSNQIPKLMRPLFAAFIKWNPTKKYMEILINNLSWNIDMVCSECLINCPYFRS